MQGQGPRRPLPLRPLAVKGRMTDEELEGALAELEETRKVAERELSSLRGRRQRVEQMERDRDTLLESYARMAPEALEELSPEEHHQIYRMLGLRASIRIDGTLEVGGTLVEGAEFCSLEVQYSMQ